MLRVEVNDEGPGEYLYRRSLGATLMLSGRCVSACGMTQLALDQVRRQRHLHLSHVEDYVMC